MNDRQVKTLTILFVTAIVTHLLSYNLWRAYDSEYIQQYAYCVLNSLTHLVYCVCMYFTARIFDNKLKSKWSFALRLIAVDWIMFGVFDVHNQFRENYSPSLNQQWCFFIAVALYDTYKITKWKSNTNKHP